MTLTGKILRFSTPVKYFTIKKQIVKTTPCKTKLYSTNILNGYYVLKDD